MNIVVMISAKLIIIDWHFDSERLGVKNKIKYSKTNQIKISAADQSYNN